MPKYFNEKRISETVKVISVGAIKVDVPFTPNYIRVKFLDVEHQRETDTITWNLVYVSPNQYQLTINYNTHAQPRKLRFLIAKLSEIKGSAR